MAKFYTPPEFEWLKSPSLSEHEILHLFQNALTQKVDISKLKDSENNSALHYCIYYHKSLNLIQWFISISPLMVYDINNYGDNILMSAAIYADLSIITFLIENYPDLINQTNSVGSSLAHAAAIGNHIQDQPLANACLPLIHKPDLQGSFPIHHAAHVGNLRSVKWLIANGADLKVRVQRDDMSVFSLAVRSGNVELLEFLKNDFDLNQPDFYGIYPIQFAAMSHTTSLQWFLALGFSPDWKNDVGVTLTHNAASANNVDNLKLLKSNNANINSPDAKGWFPIHFAAQSGAVQALNWLMDQGISPDQHCVDAIKNTPAEIAVLNEQLYVLDALYDRGISINAVGYNQWQLIHLSIYQEQLRTLIWLIDKGVDVNAQQKNDVGETPVMSALLLNDISFLRVLYHSGAKLDLPNNLGIYPIHITSYQLNDSLGWLLEKNISPDLKQDTAEAYQPIHLAAMFGSVYHLGLLDKFGASLSSIDNTGLQAIHHAAKRGNDEAATLSWLIQHGADINAIAEKDFGNKPIHYAAMIGEVKNLITLFEAGANINEPTPGGLYPIHLAAYHGNLSALNWLIAHGAAGDQNEANENGETPAHYAAQRGNINILQALLDANVDVNKYNKYGSTPFDQALHLNLENVVNWYFEKNIVRKN